MKKLIINADEFGLTEGTNKAIIEAYKFGTVTSTTMIVNMWAFEGAVRSAKENPDFAIGIHLNLTDGRPVLHPDKVKSLVDNDGLFYKRRSLIIKLLQHKVNLEDIEREFKAQLEKLINNGIYLTHIDTHQAIILLPNIFLIIKDLVKELKLPVILPVDGSKPFSFRKGRWIKRGYTYFIGRNYRRMLKREGILMPDKFYKVVDFSVDKIVNGDNLLKRYKEVFSLSLKNEVSYLMVHPSYICGNLINFMNGSQLMTLQREEELKVLLNPALKESLRRCSLRLGSFRDITHEDSPNKSSS